MTERPKPRTVIRCATCGNSIVGSWSPVGEPYLQHEDAGDHTLVAYQEVHMVVTAEFFRRYGNDDT